MSADPASLAVQRPQTLREIAQETIKEAILDMRFAPGDRLIERELCEQLGVSRTVVREVLRYLEAERLIEVAGNRGPSIARIKPDDARQIYELRELFEGLAVHACCKNARPEDIVVLEQAVDEISQAGARRDVRGSLRGTNRFYQHVYAVGGKSIAWSLSESLMLRINVLRSMTIGIPDRHKASVREMHEILDAIRSGDARRARTAAVRHVRNAARVANDVFAYGAGTMDEAFNVALDDSVAENPSGPRS